MKTDFVKNLFSNKLLILSAVVLAMAALGLIAFFFLGNAVKEEGVVPLSSPNQKTEVFSLAAVISSVDQKNNVLMVKNPAGGNEIKVLVGKTTEILKLEFPFDPANPPKQGSFTPKQTKIGLADVKVGKSVLIETLGDIYGKTEISGVKRIQVLP